MESGTAQELGAASRAGNSTVGQRSAERKAHPEQAYRVCLGLLNLTRHYPVTRINQACRIANQENLMRLKQIKSILQTQRDQLPQHTEIAVELPQQHENIRGAKHFH